MPRTRPNRLLALPLLPLLLLTAACAGTAPPSPAAGGPGTDALESTGAGDEREPRAMDTLPGTEDRYDDGGYFVAPDPAVVAALERARNEGWNDLYLLAECRDDAALNRVDIWGNGVAIWNQERQFTVGRETLMRMLGDLQTYRFPELKEIYGGKSDPTPAPPDEEGGEGSAAALRVSCRIGLELDGVSRQVSQLAIGRQSAELLTLGRTLLSRVRQQAQDGVTAADLEEGLSKVARGELAPEALSLIFHVKPDDRAVGEEGFLLRVRGRELSVRPYRVGSGYGDTRVLQLTDGDLASLGELLARAQISRMPPNLYARHYTDLTVTVLNRENRVQARQFSGMEEGTHGELQQDFDRLAEGLGELAGRGLAEGSPEED